jgi:hypothetical protein
MIRGGPGLQSSIRSLDAAYCLLGALMESEDRCLFRLANLRIRHCPGLADPGHPVLPPRHHRPRNKVCSAVHYAAAQMACLFPSRDGCDRFVGLCRRTDGNTPEQTSDNRLHEIKHCRRIVTQSIKRSGPKGRMKFLVGTGDGDYFSVDGGANARRTSYMVINGFPTVLTHPPCSHGRARIL